VEILSYFSSASGAGYNEIEGNIGSWSIRVVLIASLIIIALLLYASRQKRMKNSKKKLLFSTIVTSIVAVTVFLFSSTIYINTISDSGGPVHWHTDIEFWVCGTEVELRNPTGFLSNKIGTSTFHEHNDKRIHLEGVVVDEEVDASLPKFMHVTGGGMTDSMLTIPVEPTLLAEESDADVDFKDANSLQPFVRNVSSGTVLELQDGNTCAGQEAETQVFVYTYDSKTKSYSQTKLADPTSYTMRDEALVPPGDCVIVEYDTPRERTNKLCLQYGVRDRDRCTLYTGKEFSEKVCDSYELVKTEGGAL